MNRSVLIVGATGLVGSACLRRLVEDGGIGRIVVLTRRPLPPELREPDVEGKIEEHVVDFERVEEAAPTMAVDTVICALGTTIKKAGSRERFRAVDFTYPHAVARLSRNQGAAHFLLVSALGADRESRFFYNRVKGDVEAALRDLSFPSLTILRPSLLLGERDEFRLGEALAKPFSFLFPGKYRPVEADQVARVLVQRAADPRPGTEIIESKDIRRAAG